MCIGLGLQLTTRTCEAKMFDNVRFSSNTNTSIHVPCPIIMSDLQGYMHVCIWNTDIHKFIVPNGNAKVTSN
jgi:hypothetical protein